MKDDLCIVTLIEIFSCRFWLLPVITIPADGSFIALVGPSVRIPKMEDYAMEKIKKSDADWRAELTPEQYRIMREKGTEPAFTGAYWNQKDEGLYRCAGCGMPLFRSETKYASGSGWPSFYEPVDPNHVETEVDRSHGMVRTEVLCAHCEAHLGHVFEDGPQPTGLRFCINSACLAFEPGSDEDTPPDH